MADSDLTSGFEATMAACKKLGLDLTSVPLCVLQIFYNSGQAFADSPNALTSEQKQVWRDSVIWPTNPEILKRGPGRPPKPK